MSVIERLFDSIDNLVDSTGDATATVTESKLDAVLKGFVALVGAIMLLIFFAVDATLTIILVGLLIVAIWLFGLGDSSNDSGPRT
ncbi:hypothetical protein [Natronorubrum daqingense]|uniref:Uncharacterized protein n=1 Tax=Natronorubrum daqingense TaxID=588898 RepID=A0A1N7FXR2_9EURY|nr:hypothetical protein [Natronorubrum daqingense]APX98542.1 hypothetical protein BB347_17705 [Natronorubrum daqingense]SIS05112.1 hypothetical protein SAMN05421809_3548 [Natronorubrum daqingense]